MSIDASWDLRSPSAPKSLCVFVPPQDAPKESTSGGGKRLLNPFDEAATSMHAFESNSYARGQQKQQQQQQQKQQPHAVLFGTERGSLHYRTYQSEEEEDHFPTLMAGGTLSRTKSSRSKFAMSRSAELQLPIGSDGASSPATPRNHLPTDQNVVAPGSIVSIVMLSDHVFLLLIDDNRGPSTTQPGVYATMMIALRHGTFLPVLSSFQTTHSSSMTASSLSLSASSSSMQQLPRMSCAVYHAPSHGLIYAAGRTVTSLSPEVWGGISPAGYSAWTVSDHLLLPGVRSGPDAMAVTPDGRIVVVAVGGSDFYAVYPSAGEGGDGVVVKAVSFTQSSQVHPVLIHLVPDQSLQPNAGAASASGSSPDWFCFFLASGRDCTVVDWHANAMTARRRHNTNHGNDAAANVGTEKGASPTTVTVASPILAAACPWPWICLLTSDGLISIRSPSCIAVALRTVEVGTRPNDFFVLRELMISPEPWMLSSISYSGEGRVLQCLPDTSQDLADRLMRLSIDSFGTNGFPRSELADAVNASFTATSYVGPEPTAHARSLLQQYLEALLGLADFDSGAASGWPTEDSVDSSRFADSFVGSGVFDRANLQARSKVTVGLTSGAIKGNSKGMTSLVCGTALLCLVCAHSSPPKATLANRAVKAAAEKLGVIFSGELPPAAVTVCDSVTDKLLREASQSFSLLNVSSQISSTHKSQASIHMNLVEAAVWLLRSCGRHERAMEVQFERLHHQNSKLSSGTWSQIKFESYSATHLSELWMSKQDEGCRLVLRSAATRRLLEYNPTLGLGVFTATHPGNDAEWHAMLARDDPLIHPVYPLQVVELLKSTQPAIPYDHVIEETEDTKTQAEEKSSAEGASSRFVHDIMNPDITPLALDTGRAMAVTFLESAIGISSGRQPRDFAFPHDPNIQERIGDLHNELAYLLMEGIISERGDDSGGQDTKLGKVYRGKLRRLIRWPLAKVHSERLLASLPTAFLEEQALLLGRMGRHEDALRILYCDLKSLDLALAYCDARHADATMANESCAYLPLVRVALKSDPVDGTKAAIQVLALRSSSMDRAAALRLLPETVPVSAVARPFLIPALVDSESEIRRLTVTSSLLRARFMLLKQQLTEAQLKAQSSIPTVPQLRTLGEPLHASKPFKARPANTASTTLPDVMLIKHFFPRNMVIQAIVTNTAEGVEGRALGDVAFVVAESSDEALQATNQISIARLPFGMTGTAWCVLSAAPARMEGVAVLTCELRYSVLTVDPSTGAPLGFANNAGRLFVEELQDMEVLSSHFH